MPTPRAATPFDALVPLGAKTTFFEHEWLPTLMRRIGFHFGVPANEVSKFCGLTHLPLTTRRRLGARLTGPAAARLSAVLGIPPEVLKTTVMSNLPSLTAIRRDGTPAQSKDWSRGSGTRYCPQCLQEHPGVFYTYWRTWWCFVCLRHKVPMVSACPACHRELSDASLAETELYNPTLCSGTLDHGSPCGQELAVMPGDPAIDSRSFVIRAQRSIARHWDETITHEPSVSPHTFRGVCIALLAARDLDLVTELSELDKGDLLGLIDDVPRVGTTPPREPLAMAALMGAAYRLITDPEHDIRDTLRRITFSRPVRATLEAEGPGSAANLLAGWPGIDAAMRGRVLRSLDRDLPPIQRLIWGTAASAVVAETALEIQQRDGSAVMSTWRTGSIADHRELGAVLRRRKRMKELGDHPLDALVPDLLWPEWATPLGIDESTDPVALQRALADALRIAGNGTDGGVERIAGIGRKLRPSMLGTQRQQTAILRQLSELAIQLVTVPPPINYSVRRQLPHDQLLRQSDWYAVSAAAGEESGRHRRALNARRFAFTRMSGVGARDLPTDLRLRPGTSDAADYSHFLTTMTAETQVAMDEYLRGWLMRFEEQQHRDGADEIPVVVAPPKRFVHAGAALGPELDDIDLPRLHEMVGNGEFSLSRLAVATRRTQRHVRWALSAHPTPSGRLVTPIDWNRELHSLPDTQPTYSAAAERERQQRLDQELRETAEWVGAML